MSIVRIQRRDNPFAQIDKATLADDRLSFRATGLLAYLLAKPDDWRIDIRHLATVKTDGYKAVAAGMRELRRQGYVLRERVRTPDGRFTWESTVYETAGHPQSASFPQGALSTGHHSPKQTHGATSGNGALSQVASTDPKPSDGKGVPVLRRETHSKARGRASQANTHNPQPQPPPSTASTPKPGMTADARAGWREALGVPWPDGDGTPPPVDLDAEKQRQLAVLAELTDTEEGGSP